MSNIDVPISWWGSLEANNSVLEHVGRAPFPFVPHPTGWGCQIFLLEDLLPLLLPARCVCSSPRPQTRGITSWSSSYRLAIGGFRRPRVRSSNRPFTRRFTLIFFSSSSFCSMRNFFNGFCRLSEKPLHSVRRGKNDGLLLGAPPNTRDYFLQQHLSKISPGSQSQVHNDKSSTEI